ncbi:MAG: hypothetical protein ACOVOV_10605 [Dolichospermum sp.]|jgi:hypothetical protein
MSKVISFSISDRYLDKLRTLYPSLTDNLAAKQFLTDGLESSLSSSLDDSLDDVLDDKLKTIIETSLDGILDERLDAVMGKLISSLSDRLSRLEERLDDSLDGRLDDMELLLRMQREASITSLIPTGEPSLFPTVEENIEATIDTVETVTDNVEDADTVEAVDTVETVTGDNDSIDEPVEPAIGPVTGDSSPIESVTGEGTVSNRQGLTNDQLSKKIGIPTSTIEKWKGKIREGKEITSTKYPKFFKQWTLNPTDSLWYEVD